MDNGIFKMRVFDINPFPIEKEAEDVNFSEMLSLDNFTIPVAGFPDPFITSTFINDDRIFVVLYHTKQFMHYHFIYSIKQKKIVSNVVNHKMPELLKNFPYKTFYNQDDEVYTFYR